MEAPDGLYTHGGYAPLLGAAWGRGGDAGDGIRIRFSIADARTLWHARSSRCMGLGQAIMHSCTPLA